MTTNGGGKCLICKIFMLLCVLGAINWGLVGLLKLDLVAHFLGWGRKARLVYILIGAAGLMGLLKFFGLKCPCEKCCKTEGK